MKRTTAGRFVGYDRLDGLWGMSCWTVCGVCHAGRFVGYDRLDGLWGRLDGSWGMTG